MLISLPALTDSADCSPEEVIDATQKGGEQLVPLCGATVQLMQSHFLSNGLSPYCGVGGSTVGLVCRQIWAAHDQILCSMVVSKHFGLGHHSN